MKKLILNEWTFVLSVLGFLFVCFLTTGFRNDNYGSIVINFLGGMMLVSLVIFTMIEKLPRKLKYVVYGFTLVMLMVSMSSCSTTGYGCKGKSKSITGYRSKMGYGY